MQEKKNLPEEMQPYQHPDFFLFRSILESDL